MSIEAMTWALKYAPAPDPLTRLVLIGYADHAHGDGTCSWPSNATLQEYTGASESTVRRRVQQLVTLGLLKRGDQRHVAHIPADRRPVVYDLCLWITKPNGVSDRHPVAPRGVRSDGTGCQVDTPRGVTAVTPEPSLNRPRTNRRSAAEPPTRIPLPLDERCQEHMTDIAADRCPHCARERTWAHLRASGRT